ncbi:hypothetical protein CPB86DRAFT_868801 [Serendipita vermifera]|nr:hypothetical protein CPB86DRAFT_868801 [Serendipita vermifera]
MFRTFHYTIVDSNALLPAVESISKYRHFYPEGGVLVEAIEFACKSISSVEASYFHFILLEVQQAWPRLINQSRRSILRNLAHTCALPSGDTWDVFTIPPRSLDVIFDLISRHYDNIPNVVRGDTPVDRYISSMRLMKEGKDKELGDRINRSIQQQLLVHIATMNLSLSSAKDDFLGLLKQLSKIISCEPLALRDQERDKFIRILTSVYSHEVTHEAKASVGEALLTGLQYSHVKDDQPPNRFVGAIVATDECFSRNIGLERYGGIIECITSLLSKHGPYTAGASLRETLIHIKDPAISFWLTQYCPEDWEFEALVHPDFSKWNDDVGVVLHFICTCRMNGIRSGLREAFLRTIVIDGPPSIRQYVVWILEFLSTSIHTLEEKEWLQILSVPALNNILEYYHNRSYGYGGGILIHAARFPWFNDQFRIANGLTWLSCIGLNGRIHANVVLQLLVDQTMFENANTDINGPLECSFVCLQTLGDISPTDRNDGSSDWNDGNSEGSTDQSDDPDGQELSHLRGALMWVLHNATTMRNAGTLPPSDGDFKAPEFATIAIQKVKDGLASPGQLRSFEFVKDMSNEEWEEWSGRIKSMVMGVHLGGLGTGPTHGWHRFPRDPDGACGSICLI